MAPLELMANNVLRKHILDAADFVKEQKQIKNFKHFRFLSFQSKSFEVKESISFFKEINPGFKHYFNT